MRCSEDEGSWSLSFSGAGFLGLYHVGVTRCLSERAPHLLQGARRFYGSSTRALHAVCIVAGKSVGAWGTARASRRRERRTRRGVFQGPVPGAQPCALYIQHDPRGP